MGLEGYLCILEQNGSGTDKTDGLSDDFEYIELKFTFVSEVWGMN